MTALEPRYMMATGEAAAGRLRLIDSIFGRSTRELLISSGLSIGWRVADIGCGVGLVSFWMSERVASTGSVAAVDASPAQIEAAATYAAQQDLTNILFHTANAYDTGLPRQRFDLVFSRFENVECYLSPVGTVHGIETASRVIRQASPVRTIRVHQVYLRRLGAAAGDERYLLPVRAERRSPALAPRVLKQRTELGQYLDPIADKMLLSTNH